MSKNVIKILDKNFSDLKVGQKMLISSPEKISEYIHCIPRGHAKTLKEMRLDLALAEGADNTCAVTTGIFLRQAIESQGDKLPYCRLIDERHPVIKKLHLNPEKIRALRAAEGLA